MIKAKQVETKKAERPGMSAEDYKALGAHLAAGKPFSTFVPKANGK